MHLHKSTQYTFTNPQIAQTALAQIHEIYFHKSIKCTCTNAQTALAQIHKTFFHKSIKCTNPEIHKKILLQIHKSTKSTFINQKIHKIDFHKSTKSTFKFLQIHKMHLQKSTKSTFTKIYKMPLNKRTKSTCTNP